MPGNEERVINFLVRALENKEYIVLPKIGELHSVSMPYENGLRQITNTNQLKQFSSSDKHKKADVYLNNIGISMKEGVSPIYNKIQRKHLSVLFKYLFPEKQFLEKFLKTIDQKIEEVNKGSKRDIPWQDVFSEEEFSPILKFLMLEGYADTKISSYPSQYILIAPKHISEENKSDIKVLTFEEYFSEYKNKIVLAARRIWIGMKSKSEGRRASSMSKAKENQKWIFKNISGEPREWDSSLPSQDRREVFYLNINTIT